MGGANETHREKRRQKKRLIKDSKKSLPERVMASSGLIAIPPVSLWLTK